jgi:hypothetical protein
MHVRLYFIAWLVLVVAVPVLSQESRSGDATAEQIRQRVLISQLGTIAVCGETCNCGTASLVSKQYGPCTADSATGSCTSGSGECCVCAATQTIAVCGEEECSCDNVITQVAAPCSVTSSNGECNTGSGACCVCAGD